MNIRKVPTVTLIGLALASQAAFAKPFKTQFVSMQLPPNWDCKQEELDWVCQPDNLAERAEAIVVVVTKAANEVDDTFPKYEEILKQSRPTRDIKGQQWVDSLHLGSEVPGFYTRYVASVKEKIAAMITYSIAESVYAKYAPVLDQMIDSIEIKYDPKAFADAMKASPGSILTKHGHIAGNRLAPSLDTAEGKKESAPNNTGMIAGLLLVAGAGGYLWWKKKKKA
jgi:LPXTG-motif cell wall-anchored protein